MCVAVCVIFTRCLVDSQDTSAFQCSA